MKFIRQGITESTRGWWSAVFTILFSVTVILSPAACSRRPVQTDRRPHRTVILHSVCGSLLCHCELGNCRAAALLGGPRQSGIIKTGRSGGSGDGVHGDGGAHVAAPPAPVPLRRSAGLADPSPALSPPQVLRQRENLRPDSPGSPLIAACTYGMGR